MFPMKWMGIQTGALIQSSMDSLASSLSEQTIPRQMTVLLNPNSSENL
jgi:hypothetical protein